MSELIKDLKSAQNLIVIPARLGSTRLPGKVLLDLGGKTVLARVIERCQQVEQADGVLVAADDASVLAEAQACGALAVMTDANHCCGTDRIAEAIGALDCKRIVNVQGDEPFVDPDLINDMFKALVDGESMVSVVCPLPNEARENPARVKVVLDVHDRALYFSRSCIPFDRDQKLIPSYWWHLGLYGYQRDTLMKLTGLAPCELEQIESLEQLRALYHGIPIKMLKTTHAALSIDTAEDLKKAHDLL